MIILRDKAYLEQREYGIKDVFYKKFILNKRKEFESAKDKHATNEPVGGADLDEKIIKSEEAKHKGTLTRVTNNKIGFPRNYEETQSVKNLEKHASSEDKENVKRLKDAGIEHIVTHDLNAGSELLAHEYGHVRNEHKSKKSQYANSKEVRDEMDDNGPDSKTRGIRKGLSRFVKAKKVLAEESKASKEAIKILKENGATEDEIKKAKSNLKDSKNTYEKSTSLAWRIPIANRIMHGWKKDKDDDKRK